MEPELSEALEQGATVVTANQRLSRNLAMRFAVLQQGRGVKVWETPDVLPWSAWIARSWGSWFDEAFDLDAPPQALLELEQEQALWEAVIEQCERGNPLFDPRAASRLAAEAWTLWRAWRLPLESIGNFCGPDTKAFLRWAAAFDARCKAGGWIDTSRVVDAVTEGFFAGRLRMPLLLRFAGFDEFTPQQQALLDVLDSCGCDVKVIAPTATGREQARRIGAPDANEEIAFAARWARARLEKNPDARIGIVVPDLTQTRDRIACALEDVLHPGALHPSAPGTALAFNISLGRPLSSQPMIHTALRVLELAHRPVALAQASHLLRSPFIGAAELEASRRGLLDARLRATGELEIGLHMLLRFSNAHDTAGQPRRFACPRLTKHLHAFERVTQALPAQQSAADWSRSFTELLQALGWPGERSRTSEEFQTIEAWRGALDTLADLERITPALSLAETLEQLRRITSAPFQPASNEAPVQVLGMLEAAGASFDYLWLMGLNDEVWPSAARPNPLLPIALQRAHAVPHASAERELAYARMITERLLASAPNVVVSYPEREGDRDFFPSPLIAGLDEVSRASLDLYAGGTWVTEIHPPKYPDTLSDPHGPALDSQSQLSGGARLMKDQAACPFRAFAAHRLGARPLDEPALGLDAPTRGILVHAALERLWSELRSHRRLCDLTEDALRTRVSEAVDEALSDLQQQSGVDRATRFYALERQRLADLLLACLVLERRRAPFEVVALEEERALVVGGLTLRVRVDRIDRLLDTERYIIIDYKTNKPAAPAWYDKQDKRLEEPQLPLYSVCNQENASPAAVLLAHVRHGGMQYRGAAVADALVPGLKCWADTKEGKACGSWEALLAYWKTALNDLAKEIQTGWATVDPKSYPGTCEYCELSTLCRKHEVFEGRPRVSEDDA